MFFDCTNLLFEIDEYFLVKKRPLKQKFEKSNIMLNIFFRSKYLFKAKDIKFSSH